MILDFFHNFGVEDQPVDEDLSFGQLKWPDFNIQPGTDLVYNPVNTPAKKPAGAGD
jgi:hypothetical protein